MAKQVFLEFEKQIEELQSKIDELSEMQEKDEKKIDLSSEIEQLKTRQWTTLVLDEAHAIKNRVHLHRLRILHAHLAPAIHLFALEEYAIEVKIVLIVLPAADGIVRSCFHPDPHNRLLSRRLPAKLFRAPNGAIALTAHFIQQPELFAPDSLSQPARKQRAAHSQERTGDCQPQPNHGERHPSKGDCHLLRLHILAYNLHIHLLPFFRKSKILHGKRIPFL